jgi:hypothetical protein
MKDLISIGGSIVALLGLVGAAYSTYRLMHANMMDGGFVWFYWIIGSIVVAGIGITAKTLADRRA